MIVIAVPKRIPGNESNEVSVAYCPQKHESPFLKGKITGKKEGGREGGRKIKGEQSSPPTSLQR